MSDLYGPVLFQGGRFQRLAGYRQLQAKGCVADIANRSNAPWFGPFHPGDLVLADPGTRDAMMHSLQCCVPDATLLPAGIERLDLADPARARELDQVTLHATERSRNGDTYLYDLDVRDADGVLVERWTGLRLQAVRKQDGSGPWVPELLGPFLQRRTEALLPQELRVAVRTDSDGPAEGVAARRAYAAVAVGTALGSEVTVQYRPDGKPETDTAQISVSHGAGVTLAVAGGLPAGCDVETVNERSPEDWAALLGADGAALADLLASENGESKAVAATRVWGAIECLRKTGHARVDLVAAGGARNDRWVLLRSGEATVATFVTSLRSVAEPVMFALCLEGSV
jgi:enediyne polyketide synthase